MPAPVGRPRVRVRPDVSECSRMPRRRRPASTATRAWPPSWAMVIALRASTHAGRGTTTSSASAAVTTTSRYGGSGWVPQTRCQRSVTTLQPTRSLLALERLGDELEVGQVGLPLVVGRLPVEAVRLVAVEDGAPVDHVQPPAAAGVGELPVGRLHVEVDRADAHQPVVGEVARGDPVGRLRLPVRDRIELRLVGLVDAEQPAALGVAVVHDAVAPEGGPAVGDGDGEAGAVAAVGPPGRELSARGELRAGGAAAEVPAEGPPADGAAVAVGVGCGCDAGLLTRSAKATTTPATSRSSSTTAVSTIRRRSRRRPMAGAMISSVSASCSSGAGGAGTSASSGRTGAGESGATSADGSLGSGRGRGARHGVTGGLGLGPSARRSARSASIAVIRWAGSLTSRPVRTDRSGPAWTGGSGSSVASAVRVAIADERSLGAPPST